MANDWISIREASKQSGYTEDYLRTLIRQKAIKARKVVIVWLVNRKSLDAYARKQTQRGERTGRPRSS